MGLERVLRFFFYFFLDLCSDSNEFLINHVKAIEKESKVKFTCTIVRTNPRTNRHFFSYYWLINVFFLFSLSLPLFLSFFFEVRRTFLYSHITISRRETDSSHDIIIIAITHIHLRLSSNYAWVEHWAVFIYVYLSLNQCIQA